MMTLGTFVKGAMPLRIVELLQEGNKTLDEIVHRLVVQGFNIGTRKTDLRTLVRGRLSTLKKKGIAKRAGKKWKLVLPTK